MSRMQCDERSNTKGEASFLSLKMIGFYSVGPNKNYLDNCSQLKYLNRIPPKQVNFDLNHNIDSWKRDSTDEKLKFITSFFKDHRETFDVFDDSQIALDEVPFMCCRALLKDFCTQPYANKYPLRFTVCLFRGIFFLHYLDSEQYLNIEHKSPQWEQISAKWGMKLEQYLLSSDPSREPDISSPIEANAHFYSVFERNLERHRLIFSAEMDGIFVEHSLLQGGINPDTASSAKVLKNLQDATFIEIKSFQIRSDARRRAIFRKCNSMNWWIQSHLTGVESIFCGLKDDKGVVKKIKEYVVEDLPEKCGIPWKPQVCFNVCNNILTFIKTTFSQELKLTSSNRGRDIRMLPLKQLIFERKEGSNLLQLSGPRASEDISILDDWFIDMFVDNKN